ncbi:nucleotide pyrophosphohydrolase [uncultured Psychrobacter sp.]|uniref:nucleotide pyrophosphohydrolase n=1 Tax=uncultured Psychrobacter sp. TaxID=259303 RepID=UPI0025941663|nr:nucleotide pyrophosphohydrolase [uncultured Psychrobacter sp.]
MDLKSIEQTLATFSEKRDWDQFHSPKNLAIALSVEASELLEIFQWLTEEQSQNLNKEQMRHTEEEIADIAIYTLNLCRKLNIDLEKAVLNKIESNAIKYPEK